MYFPSLSYHFRIRGFLTIWYRSGSGYFFLWSDPDPRCLRPDPQPWYREPIAQNWCWLYIIYYSQNIILSNIWRQYTSPSPLQGRIYYFAKRGMGGGRRLILKNITFMLNTNAYKILSYYSPNIIMINIWRKYTSPCLLFFGGGGYLCSK